MWRGFGLLVDEVGEGVVGVINVGVHVEDAEELCGGAVIVDGVGEVVVGEDFVDDQTHGLIDVAGVGAQMLVAADVVHERAVGEVQGEERAVLDGAGPGAADAGGE